MFKRIIPLLMLIIIWAASPALAKDGGRSNPDQAPPANNPIYQQPGSQAQCFSGLNGRGKVIKWVKSKEQCRNQSTGQSWGHSGHYENFYRDHFSR